MGLQDITEDDIKEGQLSTEQRSSSGEYPKFKEKVPYLAIWQEDGEYKWATSPQNQFITYEKSSKHSSWERKLQPEEMERYWMNNQDFNRVVHMVQKELDMDLVELLRDDAEKALRAIKRAAKAHSPQEPLPMREDCPVCGESIHCIRGEYEMVGKRRVHKSHTVEDLAEAGLLE